MRCEHGMEGKRCVNRNCPNFEGNTDRRIVRTIRPLIKCSTEGCDTMTNLGTCYRCRGHQRVVSHIAHDFDADTARVEAALAQANGNARAARLILRQWQRHEDRHQAERRFG